VPRRLFPDERGLLDDELLARIPHRLRGRPRIARVLNVRAAAVRPPPPNTTRGDVDN